MPGSSPKLITTLGGAITSMVRCETRQSQRASLRNMRGFAARDSIVARWRHGAPKPPRRKQPPGERPKLKSLKMPAAWSRRGTSGRPSACPCCSRRRSAARLRRGIGFCGCAVRPAAPRRRSICELLIATLGPRSPASSRRRRVATVGRARRSPSSSASRTEASPTRRAKSTRGAFWETDVPGRPRKGAAARQHYSSRSWETFGRHLKPLQVSEPTAPSKQTRA